MKYLALRCIRCGERWRLLKDVEQLDALDTNNLAAYYIKHLHDKPSALIIAYVKETEEKKDG
ncbi:MAG: hypothetical protein ACXAEN_12395 [Candidatus Thorarchaeota archaeon]|jgi:hypothetical protein